MYFMAVFSGTIAGSLHDPIFIVCLVVAAAAAFFPRPWTWIVVAAVAGFLARSMISASNRAATGTPDMNASAWVGTSTVIAMLIVFLVALSIKHFVRAGRT